MESNKKGSELIITAPLDGTIIGITEVPDPIFSGKMMGDGVAIIPEDGKIYPKKNEKVVLHQT